MDIIISNSKQELGAKAAKAGADKIRDAIQKNGIAHIIVATGASQFEMLAELVKEDIDWSKVVAFHLDEYIGLSESHPASFRKYLKERFVDIVTPQMFHYVNGENESSKECKRLGKLISNCKIDVAFVGIGENGHLAFNDPPADFETNEAYLAVELDDACRKQQMGEGWFPSLEDVPKQAISMSVKQIMKAETIICCVPDFRKAQAVKNSVEGEISNRVPASILQKHGAVALYLESESSSMLSASE